MAVTIERKAFEKEVLECTTNAAVLFTASWSAKCREFEPIFDTVSLMQQYGKIKFMKFIIASNLGSDPDIMFAQMHGVSSIPVVFLYSRGECKSTFSLQIPKEQCRLTDEEAAKTAENEFKDWLGQYINSKKQESK